MTGGPWATVDLKRIGQADELQLAARDSNGRLRSPVTIWVVAVNGDLYVRSWRGEHSSWYRSLRASHAAHVSAGGLNREVTVVEPDPVINDAIDTAYRTKYSRYPSYVEPMVSDDARATTLRLVPAT